MNNIELKEGSYYLIQYKNKFNNSIEKAVAEYVNEGTKLHSSFVFTFTKKGCNECIPLNSELRDLKVISLIYENE